MIDLKPACQHLSKLVAGIGEEQLDNSTPCPEYAVRDLIEHLDESARGFAAAAGADADTTPLVAGSLPHGWREMLGSRLKTLGEAWDDPAAWQGRTDFGGGLDFSNEEWGKIALTEVVVHGWDLSKATGLPFELPETTVQDCYDHVSGFLVEPQVPELWAAPVEVPADAPLMDRLVAIGGRRP